MKLTIDEVETSKIYNLSEIQMEKRTQIKLQRAIGDRNRMKESDSLVLWYDSRSLEQGEELLSRLLNLSYTGVVLYSHNFKNLSLQIPDRFQKILHLDAGEKLPEDICIQHKSNLVISSSDLSLLTSAREHGIPTCYRAFVDDAATLHGAIQLGVQHQYLMVSFQDPTNIPLELVIASLQATNTVLIKEITDPMDIDDAVVTLGVMEVGADGVMYSPRGHFLLDAFMSRIAGFENPGVSIEVGTVLKSVSVGMGYRSCIDLATLFSPQEGMLVGSTSQGAILCCPEVFFLPYMELRPFRVNAGAVHSYVYNREDKTDYMTELRAGSSVMVVDTMGVARRAIVGRIKTEMRPLRLIEVQFAGGEVVNVLMQDDWHVRIFSAEAKPLNVTELKPGDRILGHVAKPGRHVGIKVDEHILEN